MGRTFAAIAVALAGVALTACDAGGAQTAKDLVREQLLDGSSAQFENVVSGQSADGRPLVCGWVNAKNRLGAYTGFEQFLVADGAVRMIGGLPQAGFEGQFGSCVGANGDARARLLRDAQRSLSNYEDAVSALQREPPD